tara:strand:- start:95 stop:526 length:432 start_codon:yes stop_codon:yes gene_type:complete
MSVIKEAIKTILDQYARNNFYSDQFRNHVANEIEKKVGELNVKNGGRALKENGNIPPVKRPEIPSPNTVQPIVNKSVDQPIQSVVESPVAITGGDDRKSLSKLGKDKVSSKRVSKTKKSTSSTKRKTGAKKGSVSSTNKRRSR